MKNLRDWWDSLDVIWQKILILNLGLEFEMGGIKNYITKHRGDFKKLENLYEEGALGNYSINQNEISDDAIQKIVNLKALMFDNAGITDLTPLVKLERLEILHCQHNNIINIDPLKDLFYLQELNLSFNKITSVDPLKNLKNLRVLELLMNNILSLEPIENLENLERLGCKFNYDSNMESWLVLKLSSKWKKLKSLTAETVSDLQNLPAFYPDLESLYVSGLKGDLSIVTKLKRLRTLFIIHNQITILDLLTELPYLKELFCDNNEIESIEPLSYLPKLERFSCNSNKIIDLTPLSKLKKLKYLDCRKNNIESLKPLEVLTELQHLDCSNTENPLFGNNKITSLDPLKNLSNLKRLNCKNNPIPLKEIEMLKTALPNCEVIFQDQ